MKIKTNGHVNQLLAQAIMVKGQKMEHPSGATLFRSHRGTVVGDYRDGTFNIFRFYN